MQLRRHRLLALALCSLLGACASPASVEGMTIGDLELTQLLEETGGLERVPPLYVRAVRGGAKTNPLGSPKVAGDDFQAALENSIEEAQIELTFGEGLALEAELTDLEHPEGAFDMPAHLTVRYLVFEPKHGDLVFDHTIRSGYMVPIEGAFTGVKRVRLAIEGAARDNITVFLRALANELGAPAKPGP